MFSGLTFKKKVWSIPVAAVVVFGISLLVTFTVSSRTAGVIGALGTVRYPALDLTQSLDRQLKLIVDSMQSAVGEGDAKQLKEAQALAGKFRQDVDSLAALPGETEEGRTLRGEFELYFKAAMQASTIMLAGKLDDAPAAIAEMQTHHKTLQAAVAAACARAGGDFKTALESANAGVHRIVFATLLGAFIVIAALILLSHFIVGSLWRQLGGDPGAAREFAKRIAAGDLTAEVRLARDDRHSLMAALMEMAGRIKAVIAAQGEMAREHERGNVDHRIDPSSLTGGYRELATLSNELVEGHLRAMAQLVAVLTDYGHGKFDADMPELPGKKGDLTRAAAEAKRSLLAINLELKRLVDAATSGNFAVRGDAAAFRNMFAEMIAAMNQVMAACETGLTGAGGVLESLARGDLRGGMPGTHRGQFAELQTNANATVAQLNRIISQIKGAAGSIDTAAREISAGNIDLSQRTEHQAASLEETASSIQEITAAVKQNAENASRANDLAIGASEVAVRGGAVVSQVVETMSSIENSSKKIVDIISVIDGIAFQTNILALNAAVEAARAGEQGRGFAVVASEVRNLAQRTVTAAKEIKELIGESVEKVGAGTALVDTAGQTMKEIVEAVKRVNNIMGEITTASADQSTGIESVNVAITRMDEATQQNAALVEEAAAAAKSLQEQAETLAHAVAVFALADGDATGGAASAAARAYGATTYETPAGTADEDGPAASMPPAATSRRFAPVVERRGPNRAKNVTRLSNKAVRPAAAAPAGDGGDDWQQF